jgi:exodeoxyribonuclease V gamma subunit
MSGLLVLHGNRLEMLRDAVVAWLSQRPLGPLEEDVFLVQSNGAAEWLKMSLARATGICAATRVELPARFLWRTYRDVLGRAAVPNESPLDKSALTWRLMGLLPPCLELPQFAPIARFLRDGDASRRLQLAERLADLLDQYQVYRADWLDAWSAGSDVITGPFGARTPLGGDDLWQPLLWRMLLNDVPADVIGRTRPEIHRRFLEELASGEPMASKLPRRITVFGASYLPSQTLEALAAVSRHTQVLMAVPNPCQYHWSDIIDGRELMRSSRRRHALRCADLAGVPLELMHAHAHPLLVAWGRQGRDFMRQLDAFDGSDLARAGFEMPRIDLFDEGAGETLLQQIQSSIRDLVPLVEHAQRVVSRDDRSVVFHVAHTAQREVEVLHDQLLDLLADGDNPLRPRDIVVMVPDIQVFAPAIRSVFGQYPREDARHIPFDIADLRARGANPLLLAMEWLLRLPQQRVNSTEIRTLLDVPAIASRFGIAQEDVPRLADWLEGAGVRWGIHEQHRAEIGLDACGEQNTWLFGLKRLLLGYSSGDGDAFMGVQPFDDVGGLDAALIGSASELVDELDRWWDSSRQAAAPEVWSGRARRFLEAFVAPTDEGERATVAALDSALAGWTANCERAGFTEEVPLAVLREAWLTGLDDMAAGSRFMAGGVTFCSLMPLRSIPFEVVCLLGMNDGDYPRATQRSDFDLMGLQGQQRPGDRSRRDDDRYLMLEAVLSARRVLSISWSGRSVRDNSVEPPSVLVSQLRDYIAAGWGPAEGVVLAQRTTEHPLQPFSRKYFEGAELRTHAREWRQAHAGAASTPVSNVRFEDPGVLTIARLTRFLKNPVRDFFRTRLDVYFPGELAAASDDESFGLNGLDQYGLLDEMLSDPATLLAAGAEQALRSRIDRIQRGGLLPIGELGQQTAQQMTDTALCMLEAWAIVRERFPEAVQAQPVRIEIEGVVLEDWLDRLRVEVPGADGASEGRASTAWISMSASRLAGAKRNPEAQADKLLEAWVRTLVCASSGVEAAGVLIGRDAVIETRPLERDQAQKVLADLFRIWRDGMEHPLPLPLRTGLALVSGGKPELTYEGGQDDDGELRDPYLARLFPSYADLTSDRSFEELAPRVLEPFVNWVRANTRATRHAGVD